MDAESFRADPALNDEKKGKMMINETFVAADPKSAYAQAVEKYGTDIKIVSAKQVKYKDDELRSEVVIAVPKELFMEKSFGAQALQKAPESEEEALLGEIGDLKSQLEEMRDGLLQLIEDPYANALHSALLPARKPDRRPQIEVGIIYEKLARLGVEALTKEEKLKILSWPVKPLDQIMAGSGLEEMITALINDEQARLLAEMNG